MSTTILHHLYFFNLWQFISLWVFFFFFLFFLPSYHPSVFFSFFVIHVFFFPFLLLNLFSPQQLPCQRLAPAATCLAPLPTGCTAQCLSRSPSRNSSSLHHPAAASPPAPSTARALSPTRLRVAPSSLTPRQPRPTVPPWASAALVALLASAWALHSEALAPPVSKVTAMFLIFLIIFFLQSLLFLYDAFSLCSCSIQLN